VRGAATMAEPHRPGDRGINRFSTGAAWPTERWVGILTLAALALLILIRRGFRGVDIGIRGNL
ncbi:MAG: hypothetical protein ACREMQ_00590, partial [Longimicrobiales bacterium]